MKRKGYVVCHQKAPDRYRGTDGLWGDFEYARIYPTCRGAQIAASSPYTPGEVREVVVVLVEQGELAMTALWPEFITFRPKGYRDVYWCPHLNEPRIIEYRNKRAWCIACAEEMDYETHQFVCHIRKPWPWSKWGNIGETLTND